MSTGPRPSSREQALPRVFTFMSALAFAVMGARPSVVWADKETVLSGEIEIEETEESTRSPKVVNQEAAFEWLMSIKQIVDNGGSGSAPALSEGAAQYLAVLYLYCLSKLGPCPFMLDSVLEGDVIQSRTSGAGECPAMSKFWKAWIANDLEKRARYVLSISSATAVASFNSVDRPRYVKCKDTVANASRQAGEGRYGASGTITQAFAKTIRFFSEVKDRQVDIYSTLEVSTEGQGKKQQQKPQQKQPAGRR